MNMLLPETSNIITALGWALIHALWQGLLIYTILRLALRYIPENYASVRYYAAVSAMALLTILFITTLLYQYSHTITLYSTANIETGLVQPEMPQTVLTSSSSFADKLLSWYSLHTGTIVAIYITGILLLLFRLLYNLFTLNTLRQNGTTLPSAEWISILNNSIQKLQVNKHISLLLSEKVSVPMVMGTLKPVILIPVALANKLTTHEVEAILLHELAHVKRNDYLINIIQMFIETILFYNPFVWLISSIIRKEREHCCDDIVVMKTPDRLPYAKALTALETYRMYPIEPALSATGSKNQLLIRIKRIMEMKKNNINYGQLTAVLVAVIVLLSSVTFIIPDVNAQDKKDKKKKESTSKTVVITDNSGEQATKQKVTVTSSATSNNNKNNNTAKKTIVISDDDGDVVKLEAEIEKEALKTAKLALEAANGALTELDLSGLLNNVMKEIEWEKLGDNVDWAKFGTDLADSLKNIEWATAREEVKAAINEANKAMIEVDIATREGKKEIAEAHKQIAEAHKQIAEANKQIALARRRAIEARHREVREYIEREKRDHNYDEDIYIKRNGRKVQTDPSTKILAASSRDKLLKSLEKDGLIDREHGYKIEKKGNELYIDGIKQSKEVLRKYDRMLGDDNFTIKGNHRYIKISTGN